MTDIAALAERAASAKFTLDCLGQTNTPTDIKDRIASDARYKLASDAYWAAEREYQSALNSLSTDELIALSRKPSGAAMTAPPDDR